MSQRMHLWAVVCALEVLAAGCGGPKVETVLVEGQVVKGGQPLAGSNMMPGAPPEMASYGAGYQIHFYSDSSQEGSDMLDGQGKFSIQLPPNRTYKVVIIRMGTSIPVEQQQSGGQDPQAAYGKFNPQNNNQQLQRFANLSTTPITIEVGSEDIKDLVIDLDKY